MGVLKLDIEKIYNIIAVPSEIHFLLHAIRYVEFKDEGDFKSTVIFVNKSSILRKKGSTTVPNDENFL